MMAVAKKATAKKARKRRTGATVEAMEAYGIDKLCESIMNGKSLTSIAKEAGASLTRLLTWIDADADRSARVKESRRAMAKIWDEKAENCIAGAADEFELRKARELAHHYRWRASKVAPREYGKTLAIGGADDLPPVQSSLDATKLSDAALKELLSVRRAEADAG